MEDNIYDDVRPWTRLGQSIMWDLANRDYGSITEAYVKPSSRKVAIYNSIERRAKETPGYNDDLCVVGKSSHFFSTIYTYTDGGQKFVVKDTPCHIYRVAI